MRWLIFALAPHLVQSQITITNTTKSLGGASHAPDSCVYSQSCIETFYYSKPVTDHVVGNMSNALQFDSSQQESCTIIVDADTHVFLFYKNTEIVESSQNNIKIDNTSYIRRQDLPRSQNVSTASIITWTGPRFLQTAGGMLQFKVCTEYKGADLPQCHPFKDITPQTQPDEYQMYTTWDGTDLMGCIEPNGNGADHAYENAVSDLSFTVPAEHKYTFDFFGTHPYDTMTYEDSGYLNCTVSGNDTECGDGHTFPLIIQNRSEDATFSWEHTTASAYSINTVYLDGSQNETYLTENDFYKYWASSHLQSFCGSTRTPAFTYDYQLACNNVLGLNTTHINPFFEIPPDDQPDNDYSARFDFNVRPLSPAEKAFKWPESGPSLDNLPDKQGFTKECIMFGPIDNAQFTPAIHKYIVPIQYSNKIYTICKPIHHTPIVHDRSGWRVCAACHHDPLPTPSPVPRPSAAPTETLSSAPSAAPSDFPSEIPTKEPTDAPTNNPALVNPPTSYPTAACSNTLTKNPHIELVGSTTHSKTDYQKSVLGVIARAGQTNGHPFPLFGIGDFEAQDRYEIVSLVGAVKLRVQSSVTSLTGPTYTNNDIDIAPWISNLYDDTDVDSKDFMSYIDSSFHEASALKIKLRAPGDSLSATLEMTTNTNEIQFVWQVSSAPPVGITESYNHNWRSAIVTKTAGIDNKLCDPVVILPYYGDDYNPNITCFNNTLAANKAYVFCTTHADNDVHDCSTVPTDAAGWIFKQPNGDFVMLNYTGNISGHITIGPHEEQGQGAPCTITSPPESPATIGVVNYEICNTCGQSGASSTPSLTSIDISECDGYYAHEPGTTPFGEGETDVKRYLKSKQKVDGTEWYNAQGHFWGGAYVDNEEFEYTWFDTGDFKYHPVARYILAPHQDFDALNVAPAFIELKLVFNRCKQTEFKCSIRAHPITTKTITAWNSAKDETVLLPAKQSFQFQGGHSWYKNGVSVRRNENNDVYSKDTIDVFFAPYNSPFMLRVSVDSTAAQNQVNMSSHDINPCTHGGHLGCEPMPLDGWHDGQNKGCLDYSDTETCRRDTLRMTNSSACQDTLEDCMECVKNIAGNKLYSYCSQCNSGSTLHQELAFEVGNGDFINAIDILNASVWECEGHDSATDVLASTDFVIVSGTRITAQAVREVNSADNKYHLRTDNLIHYAFLNGETVRFQCHKTNGGAIPKFTNDCPNFDYTGGLTCADVECGDHDDHSRHCHLNGVGEENCAAFFNQPALHCAACGDANVVPARKHIKYKPSIVPLSILSSPEDDRSNSGGTLVDEAFTPSTKMLFSDVTQIGAHNDKGAPITFIPQGIPYVMRYDWAPGCSLSMCEEIVIHERELMSRGLPGALQPFLSCDVKKVRVELDLETNKKTDWSTQLGGFDGNKLQVAKFLDDDVTPAFYHEFEKASARCDELGSTVCYAVGKTTGVFKLYEPKALDTHPFYDASGAGFEISIRQLVIRKDFFHSLCRSNVDIETLVLSHATPLPMELNISDLEAFNGCTNLKELEFRNIVVVDEQSFINLYIALGYTSVSDFKFTFDENIASSFPDNEYFECPQQGSTDTFKCNVKPMQKPTAPEWSTTKTYTQRRSNIQDSGSNANDNHSNTTLLIVVAGVVFVLVIAIAFLYRMQSRRSDEAEAEARPMIPQSQQRV